MFRAFLWGVVLTILAAAAGGYAVLRGGLIPANADAKPGWFETWAAGTSLDATLAREAPKSANPVPLTDANLIVGIDLYGQHCAICHGANAKGGVGPNLTVEFQRNTRDVITKTIMDGRLNINRPSMPAWAGLGEPAIEALVQFIESIQVR